MARLFDEYDEDRVKEPGKRSQGRRQRTYRSSNPVTPIPRRASASSPASVRVRSRYTISRTGFQEGDEILYPTVAPSATWQDEAVEYEIERHLSLQPLEVLEYSPFSPSSPSVDELDTLPPMSERAYDDMPSIIPNADGRGPIYRAHLAHVTHRAHMREADDICEVVTNPPPVVYQPHNKLAFNNEPSSIDAVVEADTIMDDTLIIVPSLPFDIERYPTQVEDAVDSALTVRARELLHHNSFLDDQPAFIHNPADYLRWWLLRPGHLEFLCWLGAAVLLAAMMCMVLVMMGLGLGWMSFGHLGH